MSEFLVEVRIKPRAGLLDPQGKAIHHALHTMEFPEVEDVRVGRLITLRVSGKSKSEIHNRVLEMCSKLLANPVTEDFEVEMHETHKAGV